MEFLAGLFAGAITTILLLFIAALCLISRDSDRAEEQAIALRMTEGAE